MLKFQFLDTNPDHLFVYLQYFDLYNWGERA